jgi:hypothetical protein
MMKLLPLTLLTLLTLAAAAQNLKARSQPDTADTTLQADNLGPNTQMMPATGSTATDEDRSLSAWDDICYRIRAYIFKRDDDHAPKLVGSTTCGPRQPQARKAALPQAHFEPLK